MPYTIRKRDCKQSSGKRGTHTLSYTDKKGKKHSNCHTSKKNAQAQISAIEMPEGDEVLQRKGQLITQDVSESYDVDHGDIFFEGIMVMLWKNYLNPEVKRETGEKMKITESQLRKVIKSMISEVAYQKDIEDEDFQKYGSVRKMG